MVAVTYDELEVNAVFAALDDRIKAMNRQLMILLQQRDSPDNAFAVDATRSAITHAWRAKRRLLAAVDEPHLTGCPSCGADESSRHWVDCPERMLTVYPTKVDEYQARGA